MISALISEVYAAPSRIKDAGLGVFTRTSMNAYATLEECIALPFAITDNRILEDHRLDWDDDHDAVGTGCAMLYNHSDTPNVEMRRDYERKMFYVVALRQLFKNEELLIKYKCEPWWPR